MLMENAKTIYHSNIFSRIDEHKILDIKLQKAHIQVPHKMINEASPFITLTSRYAQDACIESMTFVVTLKRYIRINLECNA